MNKIVLYLLVCTGFLQAMQPQASEIAFRIPGQKTQRLKLNALDPLSNLSYRDLIRAQFQRNPAFILAGVYSPSAGLLTQFFEADRINKLIFDGSIIPQSETKELLTHSPVYLLTSAPTPITVGNVHYFLLNNPADTTLDYLGSDKDLLEGENKGPWLRLLLTANYGESAGIKAEAQYRVGTLYQTAAHQDNERAALTYFTHAAQQTVNRQARIKALLALGKINYKNNEYGSALMQFQSVIDGASENELTEASEAAYYLGSLYHTGGHGVPPNTVRARMLFEWIVNEPAVNTMLKGGAYYQLAQLELHFAKNQPASASRFANFHRYVDKAMTTPSTPEIQQEAREVKEEGQMIEEQMLRDEAQYWKEVLPHVLRIPE